MKAVIACGGTGGHFYPGYVLGKSLIGRGHEVLFVLRTEDPAAERLRAEGLPFIELDLRGMPRKVSPQLFQFVWRLASSVRVARNAVRAYRPAVAAGMGGYLTFPLALAARLNGVPLVLHESNAMVGLANKLCLRWASVLAQGLPLERPLTGAVPGVLTGTPVRAELWKAGDRAAALKSFGFDPHKPSLLVFGGSQGARAINRLVPAALGLLTGPQRDQLQILHLSGPKDEVETVSAYSSVGRGLRVCVRAYLPQMHQAYAAADLVLCRAGASTLAELFAQRKPALLVPLPTSAEGHQEANARVLEKAGAAGLLLEPGLTPERLAKRLSELLFSDHPKRLQAMSKGFDALKLPAPERSGEALADLVEDIGKRYLKSHA